MENTYILNFHLKI